VTRYHAPRSWPGPRGALTILTAGRPYPLGVRWGTHVEQEGSDGPGNGAQLSKKVCREPSRGIDLHNQWARRGALKMKEVLSNV
jgi:hypothetical protein